jgi:UDP-N-acetyl-D-glucosamine dehydrogenase
MLADQDCVLIATDHKAYNWREILQYAKLVVDTRGATRRFSRDARAEIVTA